MKKNEVKKEKQTAEKEEAKKNDKKEKNKMKNNVTELVFILDRSGSMSGQQKKENGKAFVNTVLFDNVSEVIHDRVPIEEIGQMTEKEYFVRGSTALIDAIGGAIKHVSTVHRYLRKEDVPEHTVFVITTDGMENSSYKYSSDQVKKMIEQKKEEGWEFLFIGANIDAVETAKRYGISKERAVNYKADATGTKILFETVECAISDVRNARPLAKGWGKRLEDDNKKRNR